LFPVSQAAEPSTRTFSNMTALLHRDTNREPVTATDPRFAGAAFGVGWTSPAPTRRCAYEVVSMTPALLGVKRRRA
jgi:hypothetical protein